MFTHIKEIKPAKTSLKNGKPKRKSSFPSFMFSDLNYEVDTLLLNHPLSKIAECHLRFN